MLKWTVSRSLSTASSTPHGHPQPNRTRRPFGDLSNTPPTPRSQTQAQVNPIRSTPARRRRCRSHGSDLRAYFQTTKPNLRSAKRQSMSRANGRTENFESFYQSTPRVDADIGPLTLGPESVAGRRTVAMTLPANPSLLAAAGTTLRTNAELPQNLMNEARVNLQSHVSDFFQQIAVAASPEDMMEADPVVPLTKSRIYSQNCEIRRVKLSGDFCRTPHVPKLAKITKLHNRCRTPYHTKAPGTSRSPFKSKDPSTVGQTPLVVRLNHLNLHQDLAVKFENVDNTVTEVLHKEQEASSAVVGKSVAEILASDETERCIAREGRPSPVASTNPRNSLCECGKDRREFVAEPPEMRQKVESPGESMETEENVYETIEDVCKIDEPVADHNDSSVSSASQLLEDPSPMSWAAASPLDFDGQFTLRRQRGIRRKRTGQQRDLQDADSTFFGARRKRAKRRSSSLSPQKSAVPFREASPTRFICEAVNLEVNKCVLETNLDASCEARTACIGKQSFCPSIEERKTEDSSSRKTLYWDLDSPKSSMTDDFHSSKSFLTSVSVTPEAPLVATVRRCLKYSPEGEIYQPCSSRGSIEVELSTQGDHIRVRVIRCKDLKRAYEGSVHAYVKATLRKSDGEINAVKRTAVHRATPNPIFNETLILPWTNNNNNNSPAKSATLDIAVWHRDRRVRRSELLGCMTLPLPLSQDKEATWHPLEVGSGRNSSTPYSGVTQDCGVTPPVAKEGDPDNNNSGSEDLTYLRHLELEPLDPLTGQPLHPGFAARGGKTPCTTTRKMTRPSTSQQQVPWGFSLSWGKPPKVERVDNGSPAERAGLRSGDYVVFIETTNVVTKPREEILALIQRATNQLLLEVYRKGGVQTPHRRSTVILQGPIPVSNLPHTVTFTAEAFPNLAPDAPPEEELAIRETRYSSCLKSGHTRFTVPLSERKDILSSADHLILFQNLDELLKLSEEIQEAGGGLECYLSKVPRITAAYRRYLSGLQRACCLLVALRRNTAFARLACEPAVPQKRRPDLTGVLLLPLEHYREMTRLVSLACSKNCREARDLAQGYREATANAGVMEPPRDTGRPLLSLQEVESRLVFARCKPFTLAMPGRQWLFGGALAKVEGRARLQPSWALLLTDLLVFARVSRDRVLFVTEEPLRLADIAEACFTIRKRPTEFRLQVAVSPGGLSGDNGNLETSHSGGCSPHGRPRRKVLILRTPSPELKAVWHNLLQRQIIYVNTGCGGTPDIVSPVDSPTTVSNFTTARESVGSRQVQMGNQKVDEETERSGESLDTILKNSTNNHNHLAQWVRNSHQIPPPDTEGPLEEWTLEELVARTPKESNSRQSHDVTSEEIVTVNSDAEQQSTASSASLSTIRSSSLTGKKTGNHVTIRENSSGSVNICRRCHRSGCPTPPLPRDPFSPLPPKISVLPPTPDLCTRHRLHNGIHDSRTNSPNCTPADGNTEDGSEDDLDCDGDGDLPYRTLRRFGTMSSLDQDDDLDDQPDDDNQDMESPPSGLRAWTARASSYVVSKMALLEQLGEVVGGHLLHPPVPPERTEFSLDPNDEEGTTSGATSGDDIWGTPTSGGPDDESFPTSPPPSSTVNTIASGEDNYGLNLSMDDDQDLDSEGRDGIPAINMDQLLTGGSVISLRCPIARRRLEPLLEEEDSPESGKQPVGWW
ncbi:uncharacterized protein LOC124177759 isoform X1 [Neodiprion fabricii]|uniref:uncharacterized protein LOC124177759 isoform X1 n=1 Tax=Neodiprion fabricii TaxID=2872261 RepID=UPI001ED8FA90|nr:uncharacterized protein LOC124177759 isoform X1 [Neodiprion fabricii]